MKIPGIRFWVSGIFLLVFNVEIIFQQLFHVPVTLCFRFKITSNCYP